MRLYLIISTLFFSASLIAQNISFEDALFKNALIEEGFDLDGDGEISQIEALEVGQIKFANKGLTSIKGIEYFKNVSWLDVASNELTFLDVRGVTGLRNFYISNNSISDLHVSGLQSLSGISGNNNQLTNLNLTDLPNLVNLYVNSSPVESLDLSNLPNLQRLNISNTKITQIDFTHNPKLYGLTMNSVDITSLDLADKCRLNSISLRSTLIKELDLTDCINLMTVRADDSQLETLKLKNESTEVNYGLSSIENLKSICVDMGEIDTLTQLIAELGYTDVEINSDCEGPETITFYEDNDRDGFGDNSTAFNGCELTISYSTLGGDCDDDNRDIYPGATEIPNNGIDEDCDGADATTAVLDISKSEWTIYPNPASDMLYIKSNKSFNSATEIMLFAYDGRQVGNYTISPDALGYTLDVSQLDRGLYVMIIRDEDKSYRQLVVMGSN